MLAIVLLLTSAAHAADLSPDDFTYLGKCSIPWPAGQAVQGLTHHPSSDTWFVVAKNGALPFVLVEFKLNIGGNATIVKTYPPLETGNVFGMSGFPAVKMSGLLDDSVRGGLWLNYGSFYANGVNNPCIAFVKLPEFKLSGPWRVPAAVHSDCIKGCIIDAPCALLRETGQALACFGVRGNTAQNQSWGAGLVSLARPDITLPAGSELQCKRIIHWPMKSIYDSRTRTTYSYSDFPRDPADNGQFIVGNSDVNLFNRWSYEANTFIPITSYSQGDAITSMVNLEGKGALLFMGWAVRGYSWYGNPISHQDPTPAGVTYANNIDSVLYPGTKIKGASAARGGHAEAYEPKWWLVRTSDVVEAYRTGNQKLGYSSTGNVRTLGGTVVVSSAEMCGARFDSEAGLLYVANTGAPNGMPGVHVWRIK